MSTRRPEAGQHGALPIVFYDGGCGLCHRFVAFLARRDADGSRFRFAPLGGETFEARVRPEERDGLPDSVVVLVPGGDLLTRSAAALWCLGRLGGGWRALARVGRIVPRPVADAAYDGVARVRFGIFGRRDATCPLLPERLRSRFLA